MSGPVPKCAAIIICESVVEDARSHNKCILNTYNRIHSARYPAKHDRMTVFASLTNGRGRMPVRVSLVKQSGDEAGAAVFELKGEVDFPDPLAVVDLTFDLRQIPVPEAGEYEVQLEVGDEIVGQRRVSAVLRKGEEGRE